MRQTVCGTSQSQTTDRITLTTTEGYTLTVAENYVEYLADQFLVGLKDSARLLGGISERLLYRLAEAGEIVSVLVGEPGSKSGRRMFVAASIQEYVERLIAAQHRQAA